MPLRTLSHVYLHSIFPVPVIAPDQLKQSRNSTEPRGSEQQAPTVLSARKGNTIMVDTRDKGPLEKESALIAEIERLLPDFARSCRDRARRGDYPSGFVRGGLPG